MRRVSEKASQLDEIIPSYQFSEHHEIRVRASPEKVHDAVLKVTAEEIVVDTCDLDAIKKRGALRVLTFGAPDPSGPGGVGSLNDYLFAGTENGNVFVTFTGGGGTAGNAWRNISAGLDGSPVMGIVANPVRGSHDAYAITRGNATTGRGIYYMADTRAVNATWVNIAGSGVNNIFQQMHTVFGHATQTETQAKSLNAIAADWRFAIRDKNGVISGATNAGPIVITTTTPHTLTTGDQIVVEGVQGNLAANGTMKIKNWDVKIDLCE